METRRIPIFPLNLVLFPGMMLPLHVFEPRYQEMVRHCLEGDRIFGVCLISSGREVGGPAEPFDMGTTCRIHTVAPQGDGRMHLVTFGVERFRIMRLLPDEAPYLKADVELVPDEPGPEAPMLAEEARAAISQYVERALEAQGEAPRKFELPEDPVALSHLIGSIVPAEPPVRQVLLETSVEERLRRGLALLAEAVELVEEGVIVARPYAPARERSPN
ncbi:MAG: LON peptidase substrate-binding domain-containing protein [Actinomycetota bacterium]